MISDSESIQMLAQCYIILCFIFPLLKYSKKNNLLVYVLYFVFVNFILCINVGINNLHVDTLLPVVSLGSLIFIYELGYKNNDKYFTMILIPILSFIILIKNSGIFFALVDIIFLIFIMIKKHEMKNIKYWFSIISPFITLVLWNRHCSYVFTKAEMAKHAMTMSNYLGTFKEKTSEDIKNIITNVFNYSFSGKELYCIIGFALLAGLLIYFINKRNKKNTRKYLKVLSLMAIIYVVYMVGIAGMYIFSMPLSEANILAGIQRYRLTIFIFIYGVIVFFYYKLIGESMCKKKILIIASTLLICSLLVIEFFSFDKRKTIFNLEKTDIRRIELQNIIKENNLNASKRYIICIDKNDSGYMYYLSRYLLSTVNVKVVIATDINSIEKDKYDYLINFSVNNEIVKKWLADNYDYQEQDKLIKLGVI